MRQFLFSLVTAVVMALPAKADDAAIRSVITAQIEAFQADDFTAAFDFASPTIQQIFETPENFGTMVRQGYPMVWRPAQVDFLTVDTVDGLLWQNVMIRDQAGAVHILEYQMIEQENGWKINAVRKKVEPGGTA